MKNSFESHLQHTFDSYCRTVVRNEARNIKKRQKRLQERQTSLDYLSNEEKEDLYYYDSNLDNSEVFLINGLKIVVQDVELAESIKLLPNDLKRIILLYYFVGLNDREIGEHYALSAGSLWSLRQRAVRLLHRDLEE